MVRDERDDGDDNGKPTEAELKYMQIEEKMPISVRHQTPSPFSMLEEAPAGPIEEEGLVHP